MAIFSELKIADFPGLCVASLSISNHTLRKHIRQVWDKLSLSHK